MTSLSVLGIPVTGQQVERWLGYYCPGPQPFRTADLTQDQTQRVPTVDAVEVTDELRDTFFMYGGGPWTWLSENQHADLQPGLRTLLGAERRRRMHPKPAPAWPSDPMISAKLVRWMEAGARPSLHALARSELRRASAGPLPRAAELAGTFPARSGPNCFGAVMAAAGQSVEDDWIQLDQFQTWLDAATTPDRTRAGDEGGQVLVWRQDGDLAHAAVTLPGGWSLHKQSQSWSNPIGVWTTDEIISSWRLLGVRLSRYQLL
ncbi:hypothetical protein [Ornithinimicrobium pratense]|uniref:Uncharacterized protein n=1 Tax=Ornithinimicrobium pratense TaxID=2593973 RepID=A0A5J6V984_9MICO|nr:hypothetical protein [Ornithinimicrobium pratense]QFG69572.1 hypothetical protein FY030_13455 [Ornithinimicrobium pratense]